MNRIEHIKEQIAESDKMRDEVGELSEVDELYLTDIKYLLSLLEIAEQELVRVAEVEVKDFGTLAKFIRSGAIKALEQLRS